MMSKITLITRVGKKVFIHTSFFGLVAMVLKPNFHLCRRQIEQIGHVLSLLCAQILLQLEPLLQLVDLGLREENSPLSLRLIRILGQRAHVKCILVGTRACRAPIVGCVTAVAIAACPVVMATVVAAVVVVIRFGHVVLGHG